MMPQASKHTFTGTGESAELSMGRGEYNINVDGSDGFVVDLLIQYDGDTKWYTAHAFDGSTKTKNHHRLKQVEQAVKYKFSCTTHVSADVVCRIGKGI